MPLVLFFHRIATANELRNIYHLAGIAIQCSDDDSGVGHGVLPCIAWIAGHHRRLRIPYCLADWRHYRGQVAVCPAGSQRDFFSVENCFRELAGYALSLIHI